MKYLSVCSGIEAASVAWEPLGWEPVAFAEIEPFPSAVLAHRFPNIPNLGDLTKHETWNLEPGSVDLLVGGTPCQSFSVAGLRKGLHDPRGGLMLHYVELAQRLRPRWLIWENVPGCLSSSKGRDFGTLLGSLADLGYGVAYRVLDAQWVRTRRYPRAVPQRRRRVFLVGCLGDAGAAAAVLFERQSVRRDSAARGAAWKGSARDTAASLTSSGRGVERAGESRGQDDLVVGGVSGCVSSKWAKGTGGPSGDEAYNLVANPLTARMSKGVNTTLDEGQTLVAYRKSKRAQPVTDDESWVEAETANTINAFDVGERDTHVVAIGVDCNNALLTGQVTETLRSRPGINAAVIAQRDTHAVAFQSNLGTRGGDVFTDGSSPTVRVGSALGIPSPPAVAVAHSLRGEGFDASEDGTGRGTPLVVATAFSITPASGQGADLQATEADVGSGLSAVSMGDTTDRGIRIVSKETARPASVRRLTPRECERLQGFPDDWTAIPWRGRAAEDCPDGPRYRALGNSMAVNCMEWLGERIAAWEARK